MTFHKDRKIVLISGLFIILLFAGLVTKTIINRSSDSYEVTTTTRSSDGESQPVNQTNIRFRSKDCQAHYDCILVQDRWCKSVLAINKNNKDLWMKKNIKDAEESANNNQTCKPSTTEMENMDNYNAVCENVQCTARLKSL